MKLKKSDNKPLTTMEMKEARTIKDLLEDRRRNPRQHKDHIETLEFSSFDGKRYRRFMEDYVKLDFSEIAKSQVREEEYLSLIHI